MNIRDQLAILSSVGIWDQKRKEIQEKRKALPKKAEDANALFLELKKKHDELASKIDGFQLEKKAAAEKLEIEKGNVRKWEGRAEKIRGDREFTALMSEIGSQKRLIGDLEAKINAASQSIKETENLMAPVKVNMDAAKSRVEHETAEVQQDMLAFDNETQKIDEARQQLLSQLPTNITRKYDQIAQKRAGLAVARLKNEVCQACMRMVPPEMHLRILKGEVMEQCPSCQRILVADTIVEQDVAAKN